MKKVDVSLLNCCFMQEQYFPQVYWSLRGQQFAGELEIICHHNGCQTGAPIGRGPAIARNDTAEEAMGDWLLWNDGDNLLPSNYVQALWQAKEQAKQLLGMPEERLIVGCPVQFISGRELARMMNYPAGLYGLPVTVRQGVEEFKHSIPISVSSLVHRSAWEEVGGFEDEFAPTEDLHFWAKLLTRGYVYVHTWETCLLKNNVNTMSLRTPDTEMRAAVEKVNKALDLNLQPWTIIG